MQHDLQLTTLVNITLIQEGDHITIRSDSIGKDEEVLALGLQVMTYLSMVESHNQDFVKVEMPTLSARAQ